MDKYHGVTEDTRPEPLKARDWTSEEAYSAKTPVFRNKKAPKKDWSPKLSNSTWRKFGTRDQDGSGSCVAQTGAMLAQVDEYNETKKNIVFSAAKIYADRVNRPFEGMSSYNMFDLMKKGSLTFEDSIPSQNMNDKQLEEVAQKWTAQDFINGAVYAIGGYVTITSLSIDDIASAIERFGCGVSLHIFATGKEWNKDVPGILVDDLTWAQAGVRHCVGAVDFILWKGEKALVVQESWGKFEGLRGQRILTESFLKKRLRYAGHSLPRDNSLAVDVESFDAPRAQLAFGDTGPEVVRLQNMLKALGFMSKSVQSTGRFLSITANALVKFQSKNGINDFVGRPVSEVRYGPKTMAVVARILSS